MLESTLNWFKISKLALNQLKNARIDPKLVQKVKLSLNHLKIASFHLKTDNIPAI